jgi:hypothetical protein
MFYCLGFICGFSIPKLAFRSPPISAPVLLYPLMSVCDFFYCHFSRSPVPPAHPQFRTVLDSQNRLAIFLSPQKK